MTGAAYYYGACTTASTSPCATTTAPFRHSQAQASPGMHWPLALVPPRSAPRLADARPLASGQPTSTEPEPEPEPEPEHDPCKQEPASPPCHGRMTTSSGKALPTVIGVTSMTRIHTRKWQHRTEKKREAPYLHGRSTEATENLPRSRHRSHATMHAFLLHIGVASWRSSYFCFSASQCVGTKAAVSSHAKRAAAWWPIVLASVVVPLARLL